MAYDIIETIEKNAWDKHIINTENPHKVTAEQTNALPSTGGALTGDITSTGSITIDGTLTVASDILAVGNSVIVGEQAVLTNITSTNIANVTNVTPATVVVANSTGTLTGRQLADLNSDLSADMAGNTLYNKSFLRPIKASTTDLVAGSSSLDSGTIYLVYE